MNLFTDRSPVFCSVTKPRHPNGRTEGEYKFAQIGPKWNAFYPAKHLSVGAGHLNEGPNTARFHSA
jgi:hypothetical protein